MPKYSAGPKNEPPKAPPPIEVPALSLDELKDKTDNFGSKALVGEGSYGRVYLAVLNDEKQVALKKLDSSSESETNAEFLAQVCLLVEYYCKNFSASFILTNRLCRAINKSQFCLLSFGCVTLKS